MRDRLIKLLDDLGVTVDVPINVDEDGCGTYEIEGSEYIADYLIENDVIVPPCKVGTRVYVITSKTSNDKNFYIFEDTITHYRIVEGCTIMCFENHLGEPNWKWNNVFLTKEEAKTKLKELTNNV